MVAGCVLNSMLFHSCIALEIILCFVLLAVYLVFFFLYFS